MNTDQAEVQLTPMMRARIDDCRREPELRVPWLMLEGQIMDEHHHLVTALEAAIEAWDKTVLRQNNPDLEAAINTGREALARVRGESK